MNTLNEHISVCICTYKRPLFLKRLLNDLRAQHTDGRFTYSIVVADNDRMRSAEPLVLDFASISAVPIRYCVQPEQNISLTRNVAIANASGDLIAFIDDDEFPTSNWLLTLFEALHRFDVDGVLGPVRRYFDEQPPAWVLKGNFYERPSYPTGYVIDWTKGRTGNVLLKRSVFASCDQPFSPAFHRAGDQDFFRRMIEKGHVFVWCDEAVAYEVVPPVRWTRKFMIQRALLRGSICVQHPTFGFDQILKSLVAIPAYTLALPIVAAIGQHRFMNLLVRLFDHVGRLLAFVGIKPVKNQLVTD